jgi:hypothetical protein
MRIALILLAFNLIIACSLENSNTSYVTTKIEIVSKGIKNIEDTNFVVPIGVLTGKWREYQLWEKHDSTWIGMKPLNLILEYEFPSSKKFVLQREIDIEHSKIVWTNYLRGYLNNSKKTMTFLKNQRNDTIFKNGELLKKETKRIYLVNDTILRIDEHIYSSPGIYKLMIVDYKRIK